MSGSPHEIRSLIVVERILKKSVGWPLEAHLGKFILWIVVSSRLKCWW